VFPHHFFFGRNNLSHQHRKNRKKLKQQTGVAAQPRMPYIQSRIPHTEKCFFSPGSSHLNIQSVTLFHCLCLPTGIQDSKTPSYPTRLRASLYHGKFRAMRHAATCQTWLSQHTGRDCDKSTGSDSDSCDWASNLRSNRPIPTQNRDIRHHNVTERSYET
jgi:hypothetical protein